MLKIGKVEVPEKEYHVSQKITGWSTHLWGYFHNLRLRERSVELAVDIVVHQVAVQVHGLRVGVGRGGRDLLPVQTGELEDEEDEEAGDAQADTEGHHQHQLPPLGLAQHGQHDHQTLHGSHYLHEGDHLRGLVDEIVEKLEDPVSVRPDPLLRDTRGAGAVLPGHGDGGGGQLVTRGPGNEVREEITLKDRIYVQCPSQAPNLVHAGEGDLESHVQLVTPRSSERDGLCPDLT